MFANKEIFLPSILLFESPVVLSDVVGVVGLSCFTFTSPFSWCPLTMTGNPLPSSVITTSPGGCGFPEGSSGSSVDALALVSFGLHQYFKSGCDGFLRLQRNHSERRETEKANSP